MEKIWEEQCGFIMLTQWKHRAGFYCTARNIRMVVKKFICSDESDVFSESKNLVRERTGEVALCNFSKGSLTGNIGWAKFYS